MADNEDLERLIRRGDEILRIAQPPDRRRNWRIWKKNVKQFIDNSNHKDLGSQLSLSAISLAEDVRVLTRYKRRLDIKVSTSAEHMPIGVNKNVLILMPFRSNSIQGSKQSHLEKLRIQHIVENLIEVSSSISPEHKIKYCANVVETGVGQIQTIVEKKFEETDLFIAIISKANVNVIYEIAVLNILQQELILLVDNSDRDSLCAIPVYFEGYAHIEFYDPDHDGTTTDREVLRLISRYSRDENFSLDFELSTSSPSIDDFKVCVERYDERLKRKLKNAIDSYEQGKVSPPQSFRNLVRDLHPSKALSSWNTLVPLSVLCVSWKPINPITQRYDGVTSMITEPQVSSCNIAFARLLGSAVNSSDALLEEGPLTATVQMEKLGRYIDDENRKWLELDQKRIFDTLFIKDQPVSAIIPLEFNQINDRQHPYDEFRNKVYLPVFVGRKVVGVRSSPHKTYYIIMFIKDFYPFDQISKERKERILSLVKST